MMRIFEGFSNVVCHMDEILVWSSTVEEHNKNLLVVLNKIRQSGMTLNRKKCVFHTQRVKFLRLILENGKILPDPEKVNAIVKMEPPTSKAELQSFLGSVSFLTRHIPDHPTLVEPVYSLLKDDRDFLWESAQSIAFQKLKELIANVPVLAIYDPNKPTIVSCDVSSFGLGAAFVAESRK